MRDYIIPLLDKDMEIYFIEGTSKGRTGLSNSLLIKDHLIDTGISIIRLKKIKRSFPIDKIIFSHWHDDHIRDSIILNDIPRLCHEKEKQFIQNIDKFMIQYDLIGSKAEIMFRDHLKNTIKNTVINNTFQDGEIIKFKNGLEFEIILTPGHSAGHCIFYNGKNKFAHLSDIDLSEFGPWYGAKDCDLLDFEDSIDRVRNLKLETVVTGHTGLIEGFKNIKSRLEQFKNRIYERDDKILSFLSETKPTKIIDLYKKNIIYHSYSTKFFKDFFPILERTMILKHFEKFLKKDMIELVDNGYILS